MSQWTQIAGVALVVAGAAATGVVVGGQAREVALPKMVVANKPTDPVPVTATVTRLPAVTLEPGGLVELGPDTMTSLKGEQVVRMAPAEWEYRELRVSTAPASYRSIMAPLAQAGAEGWETTGLSFSDAGATVIILKRQR
ncbi:MAG: hypothetical protein ABIP90_06935 [Vicinamibacterales bacterium]